LRTIALLWVEKVPYQMKWGLYDLDNKYGHEAYVSQREAIMNAINLHQIKIFWEIRVPEENIQKIYEEKESEE